MTDSVYFNVGACINGDEPMNVFFVVFLGFFFGSPIFIPELSFSESSSLLGGGSKSGDEN